MERFESLAALKAWTLDHTGPEVVALYNSIPGVKPVARFENREIAASRIWKALAQPIIETKEPELGNPQGLTLIGATMVGAKKAPKHGAKPAPKKPARKKTKAAVSSKDGGRIAAVVAMLERKGGASLPSLMTAFGWQAHSTRGFLSTLGSKHGYKVKSERIEGVRWYSL